MSEPKALPKHADTLALEAVRELTKGFDLKGEDPAEDLAMAREALVKIDKILASRFDAASPIVGGVADAALFYAEFVALCKQHGGLRAAYATISPTGQIQVNGEKVAAELITRAINLFTKMANQAVPGSAGGPRIIKP